MTTVVVEHPLRRVTLAVVACTLKLNRTLPLPQTEMQLLLGDAVFEANEGAVEALEHRRIPKVPVVEHLFKLCQPPGPS